MQVISGLDPLPGRKVALQQMRVWRGRLLDLTDGLLTQVVRERFEEACTGRTPWAYYHLARDEQINRIIQRA